MAELSVNNKRLARNTIFLYIRMVFVMLISFYTTRIILDALGVVDYGVYNVVAGFVSLFAVLNNCLTTGTNRFYNFAIGKGDDDEVRRVYNASLRIQVIIIVILLVLIETIGLWYINNKMVIPEDRLVAANYLFQFSTLSLFFVVLQVPYSSAVLAYERMDYFAIVSVFDALCKLGIALMLPTVSGDKLIFYGFLMMLITIVNFLLYYIYSRVKFPALKICRKVDKKIFRPLLSFSGWSTLDPLSYIVRDQGSNMVLNLFFGPIVNAAFGISRTISGAVTSFASNLSVAFRPQIIQSYSSGNYQRTKTLMFSMSKVNFFLQVIVAVPLIFEMDALLKIWLKDSIPEYSVIFACLVMIINCINVLNEPVSIVMVSTGKIKLVKSVSLVIITIVVPIGYVLFKIGLPPYYIYIAMLFTTIANQISCIAIMIRKFPYIKAGDYIHEILYPCLMLMVLSVLTPLALTIILPPTIFRMILVLVLSCIVTFILAYYLYFDKNERSIVDSIIGKIIKSKRHNHE